MIDIYLLIGLEQPAAAERYLDRIETRVELLRSQPRMGVRRSDIRPSMRTPTARRASLSQTNHLHRRANHIHISCYPGSLKRDVSRSSRASSWGSDGRVALQPGVTAWPTNGAMRRRNRVVLASRCWRQVGGDDDPPATGARQPIPGGERL
ncbi:type II toxin-antitoxin system RelE/ParE family toxin [Bradyrhizobium ontarionense]|uniref:type II toxin-antitoxin system RelE/ParE family toxin n=1 Tax=Bradyrhizobium ontarionense TaxID=2898149 RepID=UPI003CE48560